MDKQKSPNKTKIVIIGHGGSGKDHAKRILHSNGYLIDVSCTTRKPRVGETCGLDYYFVSTNDFLRMLRKDEIVQWNYFENGHCYGTLLKELDEKDVFIMTPNEINLIDPNNTKTFRNYNYKVLYINIPEEIRRQRLSSRVNSSDDIEIRISTDNEKFKFADAIADATITDPNYSDLSLLKIVHDLISN